MGSGLVMLGIVAFVVVAQGILWSWVFLERRRRIPDVKLMNLRELAATTRQALDTYYRQNREASKTVEPAVSTPTTAAPKLVTPPARKPAAPAPRTTNSGQRPKGK